MKKSVLIISGGGPAPGINTVIGTIAKVFIEDGFKVFGIHEGYKGLFADKPKLKEITFDHADGIFRRGGSTLTKQVARATSDYLINRFSGTILDADGNGPGPIYKDSVAIVVIAGTT